MAVAREPSDDRRWPAWLRQCPEPIFVLNSRKQLIFANAAFEALAKVSLSEARGMTCTRRETGREYAQLGQTIAPTDEVINGDTVSVRRAEPGADLGPPWWDIDFFPIANDNGQTNVVGRIRLVGPSQPSRLYVLSAELAELRRLALDRYSLRQWDNASSQVVAQQMRLIADSGTPAAIVGEAGTGKMHVARTIHALSPNRESPCICLDANCLSASAIQAVLRGPLGFGRNVGAAVIYLHNPALLPLDMQVELAVRFDRPSQLIMGFPLDPKVEIESGKLSEKLWSVIGIITIELMPLRQRMIDLPELVSALMRRAAEDSSPPTWSPEAMDLARTYSWPGNLDELSKLSTELVARCAGRTVLPSDLPMTIRTPTETVSQKSPPFLDQLLERVEARMIRWALERAKGNKSKAAEMLGVWRPRLIRRIEALSIDAPED